MNFSRFSLDNPGTIFVVTALILVFGIVALRGLPLQLLPNITQPQITIYNNWRSAAPQEVEEVITQPQEEMLRFNGGLESIESGTSRGQGQVTLTYQLGHDMSRALLDVVNRLNQAPPLPLDAGEPFVASGGDSGLPGAASILVYANKGNPVTDMIAYQELIEEVVEPRIARIPGVAQVNLNGHRPKEVAINLDPFRAAMLGVTIADISQALQRARDVSGGFADVGRRRYTVRFLGEQDVSSLGDLVIGWRGDQPIYLREVATVNVDYSENRGVSLRSGRPSYYISVSRRNDANTVELLDELNVALAELNEGPLAASDVTIELSFDASLHIRRAISLVQGNLLLGIFLATLVLFYFLRHARATLVITMTIPVSVLVAFITLDVLSLTLNVISLAGLAFAVGLVMDAAIVVQENIFRLRQAGMAMREAIIEGCSQVSGALFSSTLTTVAIFVPILFMAGVEGQLFRDLAITLSVAVSASMLTALTVLPLVTSHWLKNAVNQDHHARLWEKLSRLVAKVTTKTWQQVTWIVSILGMSLLGSWLLMPKVDFLPRADIDAISVFFNIPAGMNVSTIENELAPEVVRRLEPYLSGEAEPGIRAYNFASFNGFFTQVYIYPADPERVDELMDKLRNEVLSGLPDVATFVSRGSMINVDNGGGRNISVDIQGDDLEALLAAAREGQTLIRGLWEGGNVFARGGLSLNEPELNMLPNDRRLNAAGLDRVSVANTVRAYTGGLFVGEYFDGNDRLDMILRTERWQSPDDLMQLPMATPLAGVQKVGDLVSLERSVGPTRLSRVDGRPLAWRTWSPEGRNRLEGLFPGSLWLSFSAEGYAERRVPVQRLSPMESRTINVQLVSSTTVTGTVRRATGEACPEAIVELRSSDGAVRTRRTDRTGRFTWCGSATTGWATGTP